VFSKYCFPRFSPLFNPTDLARSRRFCDPKARFFQTPFSYLQLAVMDKNPPNNSLTVLFCDSRFPLLVFLFPGGQSKSFMPLCCIDVFQPIRPRLPFLVWSLTPPPLPLHLGSSRQYSEQRFPCFSPLS